MTSLADHTEVNTLTTLLRNGLNKFPFRLEYQYSTQLQKSKNLNQLVDPLSRVVIAIICGYIASAYRTETTIRYKGYGFYQFYRENKVG